jgi:hypothetical protein
MAVNMVKLRCKLAASHAPSFATALRRAPIHHGAVAELNAKETAVPRRQRAAIQVASGRAAGSYGSPSRGVLDAAAAPGAHGPSSSKKGNICNLLAILIAIYLYVAMQPFLRFEIFFAPHQASFVAFSLNILGYAAAIDRCSTGSFAHTTAAKINSNQTAQGQPAPRSTE